MCCPYQKKGIKWIPAVLWYFILYGTGSSLEDALKQCLYHYFSAHVYEIKFIRNIKKRYTCFTKNIISY